MGLRKPYNVALIVETSVSYGREILKGISRHKAVHGNWSIFLDERELNAPPPEWLLDWKGDGVILRSTTPALAEGLRNTDLAVVDLNDRFGDLGFPRIVSDMESIGALATEHLLTRGYRNIAFCGFENELWCEARLAGVCRHITPVSTYFTPWRSLREHSWTEERDAIGKWLAELPRPLGVVACNDVRGHHVLDACRTFGFSVPEEIAVLGVDNAETFCALCDPPLSSVVPDAARIGYKAAGLLDRLMVGEKLEPMTRSIPPKGVATRQSTDFVAVQDRLVAKAAKFIRENALHPIRADDIVAHTGTSRSTLERRFRISLGRSPNAEIVRARMARVKTLLTETNWNLNRIAEQAGFDHSEYMMVQFKRETGMTPSQWRGKIADKISQ